jgi:hypothetical protein
LPDLQEPEGQQGLQSLFLLLEHSRDLLKQVLEPLIEQKLPQLDILIKPAGYLIRMRDQLVEEIDLGLV